METIALHGRRPTTRTDASTAVPLPRDRGAILARHLLQSIGTRLHARAERFSSAAAGPVSPAVGQALEHAAERAGAAIEHASAARALDLLPAGPRSLAARLRDLGGAAASIEAEPATIARREEFLARSEAVVEEIRRVARALAVQRGEVAAAVAERVSYTRALLVELADCNADPARAGDASADPRDERWTIVREVAAQLAVRLSITAAGGFELRSSEGVVLVCGGDAADLVAVGGPTDARCAKRALGIGVATRDAAPKLLQPSIGGALGALCDLHAGALVRWAEELDRLALALRDGLNDIHGAEGSSDLDGYRGSDLLCGRRALDLAVAASGPRAIAAGCPSGASREGRFGRELADLATRPLARLAGASPAGFLGALRASIAALMHRAERDLAPLGRALAQDRPGGLQARDGRP